MKTVQELPEGYREVCSIDLQKNKKDAMIVNVLSAALAVVMFVLMDKRTPFLAWIFGMMDEGRTLQGSLAIVIGTVVYVIMHEFTHGAAMKALGGRQVKYGFTGMYAYAGSSEDYFPKKQYICIALAPVVLWGIVFAVLQLLLPPQWRWAAWIMQILNVGGAAGDLYVSAKTARMSGTILVMDTGINMTVFDA